MRYTWVAMLACGLAASFGSTGDAQELPLRSGGQVDVRSQERIDETGRAVYHASDVIGMAVQDRDGTRLGEIKDLVIDSRSGQVLYAVLGLAEVAEGKLFVVPWTVFVVPQAPVAEQRFLVIGVNRQVLLDAPTFTQAEFRRVNFTQWAPRVDRYFAQHVRQVEGRTTGRIDYEGRREDRRDDVRDRREDVRDRREDVRDRREDVRDRREGVIDGRQPPTPRREGIEPRPERPRATDKPGAEKPKTPPPKAEGVPSKDKPQPPKKAEGKPTPPPKPAPKAPSKPDTKPQ